LRKFGEAAGEEVAGNISVSKPNEMLRRKIFLTVRTLKQYQVPFEALHAVFFIS
jgi:hypothetical protein